MVDIITVCARMRSLVSGPLPGFDQKSCGDSGLWLRLVISAGKSELVYELINLQSQVGGSVVKCAGIAQLVERYLAKV